MQTDGLHPNAKAQPILAEKIEPYLFPLLEKK
jgi:acyl-CoA thioesterase-1